MSEIDAWRVDRSHETLAAIDALRAIVKHAGPQLMESIKWNAPSFAHHGEDRITLGIERKGGVRAVLHRGAAKRSEAFEFEDPDGMARWPSTDRGLLTFKNAEEVTAKQAQLTALFARWLECTA